jgi:hypothetical protein
MTGATRIMPIASLAAQETAKEISEAELRPSPVPAAAATAPGITANAVIAMNARTSRKRLKSKGLRTRRRDRSAIVKGRMAFADAHANAVTGGIPWWRTVRNSPKNSADSQNGHILGCHLARTKRKKLMPLGSQKTALGLGGITR